MKIFSKVLTFFVLCFILSSNFSSPLKACDRSFFVPDSIVVNGGNFEVHTTFCIGAGITGADNGGDNSTPFFAFGIYGPPTMQMVNWSPTSFTSDTTGCLVNGVTFSSVPGIPSDTGIVYLPPVCPFTCISPTSSCGQAHSDCNQLVFTFSSLPDSIRLYAVESGGNVTLGCVDQADMIIDFGILPVVWNSFEAQKRDEMVKVSWSTGHENNNDYYRVMRSNNSMEWEEIGTVNAVGFSEDVQSYEFDDESPLEGVNQYKIIQVDNDGRSSETEVFIVNFDLGAKMEWRQVGPVPTRNQLNLSFINTQKEPLQILIFNLKGDMVFNQTIEGQYGMNKTILDLNSLESGGYFLRVKGSMGVLSKKIVKI